MDKSSIKKRYLLEIELYEREYKKWEKKGEKIVKRYRDERNAIEDTGGDSRYNILWANVQTTLPAVFARLPKPEVSRRHKDKDPVARVASLLLERALQYEIEQYEDYASAVENSVQDRLLPGRGMAWVRYDPVMQSVQMPDAQITEDSEVGEEAQMPEIIDYECSPVDYVNWKDFGHNVSRTWEEVHIIWRTVPMTRDELIKRFGKEVGEKISLDMKSNLEDEALATPEGESLKKARIYEVWDKKKKLVIWLHKTYEEALDVKEDPLKLEGFFPCPKPLYATVTTSSLIPVPDFVLYQDQAKELDTLCERINGLIDALKVAGVYDSTQEGVQRLMQEGTNNMLIPVQNWAGFSEKGGLKGLIDWLPLDMVVAALNAAYLAREQVKAVIYEVTGIGDIIRGAGDPNETATAQRLKGQYASMRLKKLQDHVNQFATGLLRIKAQIICQHYQPETIIKMSGAEQMPPQDQALVPQALGLLKVDPMRNFRIEISSDSLLEVDEQQEKQDRMEFITAVGGFIEKAVQAPPDLAPLLGEILLFGVRGFKTGKTLEGVFDETIEKLKQQAAQPKQPQPDPEMIKMQGQQQIEQMKMQGQQQSEQIKMQNSQALEKQKVDGQMQLEQYKQQVQARLQEQQSAMEAQRYESDKARELLIEQERMQREFDLAKYKIDMEKEVKLEIAYLNGLVQREEGEEESKKEVESLKAEVEKAKAGPKKFKIERDPSGNVVGGVIGV